MAYKVLILDVDGVMTDGGFYYTENGKMSKKFGPDDNDALSLLDPYIDIRFITADKKGYKISEKRIKYDMNRKIDLVSTKDRLGWMEKKYNLSEVIYMGDGIFDSLIFNKVGYSIAPSNSNQLTLDSAKYVTIRPGGDRAVAEAVIHILKLINGEFDLSTALKACLNKY
jgi:3-deoxy-D-manno-octulosonate 8-phosphate phosphatase (KDO 8-P phosphatase)